MNKPLKGIWIDDAPGRVLTDEYLDELKDLGVHTAAIMLEDVVTGRRMWSAEQVTDAAMCMMGLDLEVVLTCAPTPSKQYLDGLFEFLDDVAWCGISGIEADKEGRWKGRARGFKTMQEASDYYVENMRRITEPYDIRLELTTHTGHIEHTKKAMTTPRMDRFVGQWYSVRSRNGKSIDWTHKYGPGRMQQLGARKWEKIPITGDKPKLSVGLAAWLQLWRGHSERKAMQIAYDTACQAEPIEIRWWSSKYVIGAKKNRYAKSFIRSI